MQPAPLRLATGTAFYMRRASDGDEELKVKEVFFNTVLLLRARWFPSGAVVLIVYFSITAEATKPAWRLLSHLTRIDSLIDDDLQTSGVAPSPATEAFRGDRWVTDLLRDHTRLMVPLHAELADNSLQCSFAPTFSESETTKSSRT